MLRKPGQARIQTFYLFINVLLSEIAIADEYENELDLSNLVLMLLIITFHSNLVPIIVSFSGGQQQGGVRSLGTIRKSHSYPILYSYCYLKIPNTGSPESSTDYFSYLQV